MGTLQTNHATWLWIAHSVTLTLRVSVTWLPRCHFKWKDLGRHLTHGSLGPWDTTPQTKSRPVQPLRQGLWSQSSRHTNTDTHVQNTLHQDIYRPHIASAPFLSYTHRQTDRQVTASLNAPYCRGETHTHTHTHPFNGPLSGTTRVSRYQKGNTNLDITEARDREWQWHQMEVCTSLQTYNT